MRHIAGNLFTKYKQKCVKTKKQKINKVSREKDKVDLSQIVATHHARLPADLIQHKERIGTALRVFSRSPFLPERRDVFPQTFREARPVKTRLYIPADAKADLDHLAMTTDLSLNDIFAYALHMLVAREKGRTAA